MKKQIILAYALYGLFISDGLASYDSKDLSALSYTQSEKTPVFLKEISEIAIPLRPVLYSFDEVQRIFEPILYPRTMDSFKTHFAMIYKLPAPTKHSTPQVIGFLQCLYARLLATLNADTDGRTDELQLIELNKSLVPHKPYLEKFMTGETLDITGFACVECLNKARLQMGFEKVVEPDYENDEY